MMMKVRSARALKYTLELIDEMMAKYELKQGEIPTVDYSMPYETTEELAKRGLVKVILPAGVTLSDDMTFVQVNVRELIESGSRGKTTEQLIVNETPEEEPTIEEIVVVVDPVAESSVVKDTAVAEENVAKAIDDGIVHADAIVADELVSDAEAEARIEVSTVNVSRTGKMGEINLDVICENFENGEIVDVDALKAKRLVSPKIGRVKVLARGVMNKTLTVKASKFSLQAVKMITLAGGKAELEE
jgi:ribosomal protein L18E